MAFWGKFKRARRGGSGEVKTETIVSAWLERYGLQQAEYLARLDLRQRETTSAFVLVGAMGALIAGLVASKGLSGFLSHESVLLVPFLSLLLSIVGFRIWVHDQRIEQSRRALAEDILPEIARLIGEEKNSRFAKMADVSHDDLSRERPWAWRVCTDFLGRGVSLVSTAALVSLFFTVLIVVQTLTSAGSLDNMSWAKNTYFAVAGLTWLLLMLLFIGYCPAGDNGRWRTVPLVVRIALVVIGSVVMVSVIIDRWRLARGESSLFSLIGVIVG